MRILVDEEYGYERYLWTIAAESAAVYTWFEENPKWFDMNPTTGMENISNALNAHYKVETLSDEKYWQLRNGEEVDAKIHWHIEEDSYIHKQ